MHRAKSRAFMSLLIASDCGVDEGAWGKGYATEGGRATIEFVFAHRLASGHAGQNPPVWPR